MTIHDKLRLRSEQLCNPHVGGFVAKNFFTNYLYLSSIYSNSGLKLLIDCVLCQKKTNKFKLMGGQNHFWCSLKNS